MTKKEYGITQRTILVPNLFKRYLNDLHNIRNCGELFSYADDTTIYYEHNTRNTKINNLRLFKKCQKIVSLSNTDKL